jgi:hypothetical protein
VLCLVLACATTVIASATAQPATELDYRIGEAAKVDIATPVDLFVFDAERTEQSRKAEALRVPPVFRFDPKATAKPEEELRVVFANMRSVFLDSLEARFQRRILTARELGEPVFAEVADAFRSRNRNFPLSRSLAELWALGDSAEDVVLTRWINWLRELGKQFIRADALPANEKLSAESVRIITIPESGASLELDAVERTGRTIARTNLAALSSVRQNLWRSARAEEEPVAAFLNEFLQPNCVLDVELTQQARAKRVETINAMDHYSAGQLIASQGQTIDRRIERALAELQSRTAADRARASAEQEKSQLAAAAAAQQAAVKQEAAAQTLAARLQAQVVTRTNKRLAFYLGFAVAGCALFAWLWLRRRHRAAASSTELLPTRADATMDLGWRERALAAEARAEKANALLRARLRPHLARWMINEMWHRLLCQRGALIESRQQAEREMEYLSGRLDSVRAPLEERLNAYERRIGELEAELALKDQQNQELLRARLEWTRRQLAEERGRTGGNLDLNPLNETAP